MPQGAYKRGYANELDTPLVLAELSAHPTQVADHVLIYGFDDGGVTQLYARLSDGTTLDLTPSGGAAPNDAPYLTNGAVGGLTAEVDVTATGAELAWRRAIAFGASGYARWSAGTAVVAAEYAVQRDADGTNQLHFNVPTGAGWEWSVQDTALWTLTATAWTHTQAVGTSGSPVAWTLTGAAHTTLAASTEARDVNLNLARTVQFATGALAAQRAVAILAPTYAFVGASTLTNAATFYIDAAPVAGTNATLTNSYALWIDAGAARLDGVVRAADGTAAAPEYTFESDTDTGLFRVGADNVGVSLGGTNRLDLAPSALTWTQAVATSGSPVMATFTGAAHTTLAASTEATDLYINLGRTVQFATGNFTTQRAVRIAAPTYSAVGATTLTDAVTVYISAAPAAGANMTLSSPKALWVDAGLTRLDGQVGIGGDAASGRMLDVTQAVATSGSPEIARWTGGAHTTLAASTEAPDFYLNLARTVQFATGAITDQRAIRIEAPTYAFVAASTITRATTFYISGAPVAGTNATLTDGYAIWSAAGTNRFDGQVQIGAGTAGAPGIAFQVDTDTGIRRNDVDEIDVVAGGASRLRVDTAGIRLVSGTVRLDALGSATAAALQLTADANTGLFWSAADVLGLTAGGTVVALLNGLTNGPTAITLTQAVSTSGSPRVLVLTGAAHTTLAASTEATDVLFDLARTVQFATGALAAQRAIFIEQSTYAFVAASTITDAATLYIQGAPVAGANATITNAYALWIDAGDLRLDGVLLASSGSAAAPSLTFQGDTNTGWSAAVPDTLIGSTAGAARLTIDPTGDIVLTQGVSTTGSPVALTVTGAAHTTLTASTEAPDVLFDIARTVQFATGALAAQRAIFIEQPTYAFVGASTLTDAATLYIQGAPVAGANATITNGYALWIDAGRLRADEGVLIGGEPAGVAGFVGYSNTVDNTANSSGTGTIKFKGATSRDSSGFLKILDGTTARFIPYFDAITG